MVNLADTLLAEAPPVQAHGVETIGMSVARRGRLRKRQHVPGYGGPAADKGVRPNANEVMDRAERSHHRPLADGDMPSQSGGIGQDDVVSDGAIMRDVRIRHDQRVTADAGHPAALDGTA